MVALHCYRGGVVWSRCGGRVFQEVVWSVMEIVELFLKAWPILLGLVTIIIVLSKLDLRVAVLEEKVKSAFEIINKMRDKQ